jgi:hypothetical protein
MSERVRFERYRLMVISIWPESAAKQAALASARAALNREVAFAVLPPDGPGVGRIPASDTVSLDAYPVP